MNRRRLLAISGLAFAVTPVRSEQSPYRVRLIAGMPDEEGLLAGIEISLAPGWKTYWRMPGEAGIPPEFNWQQSQNLATTEVLFPAPHRFEDAGGEGIGYKNVVVLPVRLQARNPGEPVVLALDLFFAVCKDVCIPANARAALQLGMASPDPADSLAIAEALAAVPRAEGDLPFASAKLAEREDRPALILVPAPGAGMRVTDVFVESRTLAYFREPRADGDGSLYLLVDGIKGPQDLRGEALRLTVIGPGGAVEGMVTVN
jgi:DsbC/DsbD-like thiol-disulfide interchange protein